MHSLADTFLKQAPLTSYVHLAYGVAGLQRCHNAAPTLPCGALDVLHGVRRRCAMLRAGK